MTQPSFGLTVSAEEAAHRASEFGVSFCDLHFGDDLDRLPSSLDTCDKLGLGYLLNFEGAPVGWSPPIPLKSDLKQRHGFMGFVLDEADHMQINAHWPVVDYYGYNDQHFLAETDGLPLFEARQAVLAALKQRSLDCMVSEKNPFVEFLFPGMMHTAAQSGLNLSPKILKETCSPIMLSVAMGAARQYGVDFWIDIDYWWHNEAIGHAVERFRSALLLAYWSGASNIYIEGGAQWSQNHPEGKAIEAAFKQFLHDYVPDHPRRYDWRDFQPEIAIIRFDDTCFDIRQTCLGEYPGPLYGHVPAGEENTEWLNIWSLLSHGFVRTDSASHQWEARRFNSRTLFAPLHNVVVFDHEVGFETLAGLRLIFLTGVMISPTTYAAVQRRVREGVVCVLPPRLALPGSNLHSVKNVTIVTDGAGCWVVVPEFFRLHYECFCAGPLLPVLREVLGPLVGDGDHLVYNFGQWVVRFSQEGGDYPRHEIMTCFVPLTQVGANPDILEVEVCEN